mmetsp:Transcript_75700/g.126232  ORF Transcript_75700/g.126232 Transcript_75700/m.126232 type:complete len:109 (-) Transcript_75700:546-872(-)
MNIRCWAQQALQQRTCYGKTATLCHLAFVEQLCLLPNWSLQMASPAKIAHNVSTALGMAASAPQEGLLGQDPQRLFPTDLTRGEAVVVGCAIFIQSLSPVRQQLVRII